MLIGVQTFCCASFLIASVVGSFFSGSCFGILAKGTLILETLGVICSSLIWLVSITLGFSSDLSWPSSKTIGARSSFRVSLMISLVSFDIWSVSFCSITSLFSVGIIFSSCFISFGFCSSFACLKLLSNSLKSFISSSALTSSLPLGFKNSDISCWAVFSGSAGFSSVGGVCLISSFTSFCPASILFPLISKNSTPGISRE